MKKQKAMNIGIIGPGRIARRLISAIKQTDLLKLHSLCGRALERLDALCRSENIGSNLSLYTNFDEMLDDDSLDAVIICTPDAYHYEYAKSAINAGKHVLIEKPICLNISEASELSQLASSKGVVAGVGYHLRWHSGLRTIASITNSANFGSIHHINIHWAHRFIDQAKWRRSPIDSKWWSLSTLGTHSLDIVRWIMMNKCGEVVHVRRLETNAVFNGNDETSLLSLTFESGATASIFSSILFDSEFQINIYGESHKVIGCNVASATAGGTVYLDDQLVQHQQNDNFYILELENFAKSIWGEEEIEVTLNEGLRNLEIMCA